MEVVQAHQKSKIKNSRSWNIIYVYSVLNPSYSGYLKIGQTSIPTKSEDWHQITNEEIEVAAKKRIKEINSTAGLNTHLEMATLALRKSDKDSFQVFRDYEFHQVLKSNNVIQETPTTTVGDKLNDKIIKSNGREWFHVSLEKVKHLLTQYKDGVTNFLDDNIPKITLREPQLVAVKKITECWNESLKSNDKEKYSNFLLDAIMRFGKCMTTYAFINENKISKILILTHRPAVFNSWKDDFQIFLKIKMILQHFLKNIVF